MRKKYKDMTEEERSRYRESRRKQKLFEYGLTEEDYYRIYGEQKGVCAICKLPETTRWKRGGRSGIRKLAVDHNHDTAEVRGLLCLNCNLAIGLVKENPDRLRNMADYLEKRG